jgi:hypothetical protein
MVIDQLNARLRLLEDRYVSGVSPSLCACR